MTLEELADRLGLKSTGALRTQIARGVLKAERVGHNWFVSTEEASRYKEEHLGKRGRPRKRPAAPQEDA